jgi:hypothetical protein
VVLDSQVVAAGRATLVDAPVRVDVPLLVEHLAVGVEDDGNVVTRPADPDRVPLVWGNAPGRIRGLRWDRAERSEQCSCGECC